MVAASILILGYKLVSRKKLKNVTDYRPLHYGVEFDPTRPFTLQNRGSLLRVKAGLDKLGFILIESIDYDPVMSLTLRA